jgi:hypothetical protein
MTEFRTDSRSAELAREYLRQYAAGNPPDGDWAAWDEINRRVREAPDDAWPVLLNLIIQAQDDAALAYIAAGPLEDLLKHHCADVIERVEHQARTDARFRQCLAGVWVKVADKKLEGRLVAAMGMTERKDPRPPRRQQRREPKRAAQRKRR